MWSECPRKADSTSAPREEEPASDHCTEALQCSRARGRAWCRLPWQRWHCVQSAPNAASSSFTVPSERAYISASCARARALAGPCCWQKTRRRGAVLRARMVHTRLASAATVFADIV